MNTQKIIDELGLTTAPEQMREQMVSTFEATVELRLAGIVDDVITDAQRKQLNQLLEDNPDTEEVTDWLNDNVANVDELRNGVAEDYLAEVKQSQQ